MRGSRWPISSANWLTHGNHNFLRISRILRSLALLGQRELAAAFLVALEEVYLIHPAIVGPTAIGYWRRAIGGVDWQHRRDAP